MKNNWFYRIAVFVLRPLVLLLFPTRAIGRENIPAGGALLCINHASAWDPVLVVVKLSGRTPLRFMAKQELFQNPILAWLLRKVGAFPVNRGGNDIQAIKTALKSLQEGAKLVVFPEGTRVEQEGEASAKGGVVMLATRAGVPMVPVYCGGKKRLFRPTTVVFGAPYVPQIAGRRPTAEENREIAEELMERIYALKEQA